MARHADRAEPRGARQDGTLRVDPTRCTGTGMCAHLAPQIVTLDSWGYPMLSRSTSPDIARDAAAAIAACPRQALFLDHLRRSPDHGPAVGSTVGSTVNRRRRGRYR